ncbi:hypothetical_protein [Candidozyma auris]|uniref:aspartic endopeptidase n=1 Tax=Candidozyma auris TaxID=498019 RepID=UPI000D2DF1A8|nr:hypothetical_protein [[Candida] auris]QEO24047.1 hypothetical_protein [[Candida] auris]GBL52711.1 hypothetical protein CAJCM15448_49850 [[Candida] auris]
MPINENSTFVELPWLDKASIALPHYIYSTGVPSELTAFVVLIVLATSIVIFGAYATVQQPKNAIDANEDKASELYDITDRDGCNSFLGSADSAKNVDLDMISYKTALAFPVLAASALYGLDYLIRKLDVSKIKLLNYYVVFSSFGSSFVSYNIFTASAARNLGYWLGLKGNSSALIKRYRLTLSEDHELPLGSYERIDPKAMGMSKKKLEEFEEFMWERNHAQLLRLPKIKSRDQLTALVFDSRLLYLILASVATATTYYLYNPQLQENYDLPSMNWLLNNTIATLLAMGGLAFFRIGNIKVASVLLIALFAYDIYFVFKSTLMISVATGIDLPVKIVFPRAPASLLNFKQIGDMSYQQLALPASMLGLGDIVIPGTFASLCLRFDYHLFYTNNKLPFHKLRSIGVPKYFTAAIVAYVAALMATMTAVQIYDCGQPALLYIVPAMIGAVALTAVVNGQFRELWDYKEDMEKYEPEKLKHKRVKADEGDKDVKMTVVTSETLYEFGDVTDESDDTFIIDESTDADDDSDESDLEAEISHLLQDQEIDVERISDLSD